MQPPKKAAIGTRTEIVQHENVFYRPGVLRKGLVSVELLGSQSNDPGTLGGSRTASNVVQSSDTLQTIAAGPAAPITADSNLQSLGVNAIADSQTIFIKSASLNNSSFAQSTSAGATEVISLGFATNAIENAVVGGTATASDVLSISVHDAGLSGSVETISHTVTSGQSLSSIASSLASAINGDSAHGNYNFGIGGSSGSGGGGGSGCAAASKHFKISSA